MMRVGVKNYICFIFGIFILGFAFCNPKRSAKKKIIGVVYDSLTKRPGVDAEVLLLRWYMSDVDEMSYEKRPATTNSKGEYEFDVSQFEYLQIGVKSRGYYPYRVYLSDVKSGKEETFLRRCSVNPLLTVVLDRNVGEEIKHYPRLKIRFYYKDDKLIRKENVGYSFAKMSLTSNLNEADIWIDSKSQSLEDMIIYANKGSEITAINAENIKENSFVDYEEMPLSGYKSLWQIGKADKIFFVQTNDSVNVKLIKLNLESENRIPNNDRNKADNYDYIIERELNFHALILKGGKRDFRYCSDIDLEDYLVNIEYR